jgi:predicted TIM-barrel fold metal-dependent hydrolase
MKRDADRTSGVAARPKMLAPDRKPHPPRLPFPAGACDCHAHAFGPQSIYPCTPSFPYLPPDVSPQDYEEMLQTIGCQRAVLVQHTIYGTDNSCMVAAMKSGKLQYRGVAIIDQTVSDKELDSLHAAGVRAARISVTRPALSLEDVSQQVIQTAARINRLGWHLQFLACMDHFPWIEQIIAKSPLVCVVDHFGLVRASDGMQAPGFSALLRLVRLDHVWFKLIGYRGSIQWPHYPDVTPLVRALMAAAPDRCVWGSDWPHTNLAHIPGYHLSMCDYPSGTEPMPNDGDLADALGEWLPIAETRRRVLVDNPVRLYGFE